jgi:hypothetical protein
MLKALGGVPIAVGMKLVTQENEGSIFIVQKTTK